MKTKWQKTADDYCKRADRLAAILTADVRRQIALGEVALLINLMDESISSDAVRAAAREVTEAIQAHYASEAQS